MDTIPNTTPPLSGCHVNLSHYERANTAAKALGIPVDVAMGMLDGSFMIVSTKVMYEAHKQITNLIDNADMLSGGKTRATANAKRHYYRCVPTTLTFDASLRRTISFLLRTAREVSSGRTAIRNTVEK